MKPISIAKRLATAGVACAVAFAQPIAALAAVSSGPQQSPTQVWFLRSSSAVSRSFGAAPMIYANGAPIGTIPANSDFHHDFAPGSYRFTVQPYGAPTGRSLSVQLRPGSRTYIAAQYLPVWQAGLPSAGRGAGSHSFFLFEMTPRLARAYLPSLTSLGQV